MPTNLTPEYRAAEAAYRRASSPKERLECLREMLRTMPKHKGTDHLQAEVKTRIKQLTDELTAGKRGAAHTGPATFVHPEGAAQVVMLGPPNAGKSSLHSRLTGSHAQTGPYAFTTQFPQPGMLAYEDIHLQLVDLPPVSPEHPVPWLADALRPADACALVVDLGDPGCVEQLAAMREMLQARHITLSERWPTSAAADDPFAISLPALMLANKSDQIEALSDQLEVLRELTGLSYPVLAVSAATGEGLDSLGAWLFRHLEIARVYTKVPGRSADRERPFTVRRGQTVQDLALLVHRDLARGFRYARIWGAGHFQGQKVGRDHPLQDGDVVELHN